jgi:glutamyl-tRNA synthetase
LKRGDGGFSYQLACAVDDVEMQMTEVVRGADLVTSAPRQARIAELLGRAPPKFTHVPLTASDDGARLAKRAESAGIRNHRERGTAPEDLVRAIAGAYGHPVGRSSSPLGALAESYDPRSFPGHSVRVSDILERLQGGR